MSSRFIIIAILIFIKVIGVASRARAFDYFDITSCYSAKQVNYIIKKENYYNPVYRCGQPKYNLNTI